MSKQVESVGAVLKVFSILQALSRCQTASLSELETQLMMPKSTIYRFLQTMQTLGYITQNEDNVFILLQAIRQMGQSLFMGIGNK